MTEIGAKEFLPDSELPEVLLGQRKLIDVRSPGEFISGHSLGAINLPILTDAERVQVGTCYKRQGREKAIELGLTLVNGVSKSERLSAWLEALKEETAVITCFRGGLRSQFAQVWCREAGISRPRIQGGYKLLRSEYLRYLEPAVQGLEFLVLTGMTGVQKTQMILQLSDTGQALNLEGFAQHRGSAFGGWLKRQQPHQAVFENTLIAGLMRAQSHTRKILVEDESRLIGRCSQPEVFFTKLRSSSVVVLQESLEHRVEHILAEYVLAPLDESLQAQIDQDHVWSSLRTALQKIERRLGGLNYHQIAQMLEDAIAHSKSTADSLSQADHHRHRDWIRALLEMYYDPMYASSFGKRSPVVSFQGNSTEVSQFLRLEMHNWLGRS